MGTGLIELIVENGIEYGVPIFIDDVTDGILNDYNQNAVSTILTEAMSDAAEDAVEATGDFLNNPAMDRADDALESLGNLLNALDVVSDILDTLNRDDMSDKEKAARLMIDIVEKILPLSGNPSDLADEADRLRAQIDEKLDELNDSHPEIFDDALGPNGRPVLKPKNPPSEAPEESPNAQPDPSLLNPNNIVPPSPENKGKPDDVKDAEDDFNNGKNSGSPLVLDLDGQGVDLSSVESSGSVYWDIDEDGFAEASGWISGNDGLLAIDLNSDGIINDHNELFGSLTTDGFSVLSSYGTNTDNVIDSNDAQFSDLLVWVDENTNGYSESDELYSLDDLGITSINLNANLVDYYISGNHITHESTFTINGQEQTIVDAWFTYDNVNTIYSEDFTLDVRTLFLPSLRGFGNLKDLHIAMSMDEQLLLMVQEVTTADMTTLFDPAFDINSKFESILYRWAGVENIDPMSRGGLIDARKLEFLEQYIAEDFFQVGLSSDPGPNAADILTNVFDSLFGSLFSHIFVQVESYVFYDDQASYNLYNGVINNSDIEHAHVLTLNQTNFETTVENDVYIVGNDSGSITINEQGGVDEVWIAGVEFSNISFENNSSTNDLIIHIGNEAITIRDQFRSDSVGNNNYDSYQVENLVLDDGTVIDLLNGLTFSGTSGNDTLTGLNVDDILVGGLGADAMNGGLGNDTYVWSVGDDNDTINETGGVDQLVLHGVSESDIRIEKYGNYDLRINVGSEYITVDNQYRSDYNNNNSYDQYQVESILLDDGSTIDLVNSLTFTGTSGSETINGLNADDILFGLDGADTLNGNNGDDALHGGNGSDDLYGGDGDDVLYGGAGVDMLYGQSGADTFVFDDIASSDNVQDFNLSEGDKLDVSDLISGYDPLSDAISDFVQITESGSNSYLSVDADGGADNFFQVAYLYNTTGLTDEEALETSGNLIAA